MAILLAKVDRQIQADKGYWFEIGFG